MALRHNNRRSLVRAWDLCLILVVLAADSNAEETTYAVSGNASAKNGTSGFNAVESTFTGDIDHLAFRVVERRQHAQLKSLLRQGMSANLRSADGTTLLMYAALHGDAEGVRILLDAGADSNATNNHGATALLWGAADAAKVRLLLEHGANVNAESDDVEATPLSAAAAHTRATDSLQTMLDAGANVKSQKVSPLVISSALGSLDSVKVLLNHYKKLEYSDPQLDQALGFAAVICHTEIESLLLEWDGPGRLEKSDSTLQFTLGAALRHSENELARSLLDLGAKVPNLLNVAYSDEAIDALVPTLIERGTNIHAKNQRGYTALDFARLRGHKRLERILVGAGAKGGRPFKNRRIPQRHIKLTRENRSQLITKAVEQSLELMFRSSDAFLKSRGQCISCHHQTLPAVAASIAHSRGIEIPLDAMERIEHRLYEAKTPKLKQVYAREFDSLISQAQSYGYRLWGRSAQGIPADHITKAFVWYLAGTQQADGHWQSHGDRMPMEDGDHQATALGLRALNDYPIQGRRAEFELRVDDARRWLEETPATTHTDQAFRLLGLAWASSDPPILREAVEELLKTQQPDGGWAQLENLESDAWATGLALLATQAAGLDTSHPAYKRGMEFLLSTQFDDGSWFVRSRSDPGLPHFDSRFPFGWDQWISAAGTAVATASLALALEPVETKAIQFAHNDRAGEDEKSSSEQPVAKFEFNGDRSVSFSRDVLPIFETSCIDCHSGDAPSGQFSMASSEDFIQGGQSGTSPVVPGNAKISQLIRHVTNQIEDMEMPPLDEREAYPGLTPKEVLTLTNWINEGADWPGDAYYK